MDLKCIQRCRIVNEDLVHRSIDVAKATISFINTISKEDLQDLGVSNQSTIMMPTKKVLGKKNQVKNV